MKNPQVPTVALFFGQATTLQIMEALGEVAEQFQLTSLEPVEWYFPDNTHWRVLARLDDQLLKSYTDVDRQLLQACLGAKPSTVLKMFLNQRLMSEACDAGTTLVVHLLGKHHGIADDCSSRDPLWTFEQIRHTKHGTKFLDSYR